MSYTHIKQNSTLKKKQIPSQSYTKNEGHITANECNTEKTKPFLLQALDAS
jgi:hypothetical protein